MKKMIITACLLVCLAGCKGDKEAQTVKTEAKELVVNMPVETHKEFYGIWTGMLNPIPDDAEEYQSDIADPPKKISIKINKIVKDSVYGQSIAGGNQRPLVGVLTTVGNKTMFTLDEPGTNKYDGRFELVLKNDTLQGKWTSYKNNGDVYANKTLALVQKQFVYNPNFLLEEDIEAYDWEHPKQEERSVIEGENSEEEMYVEDVYRFASENIYMLNASKEILTEEQLKNLRKLDLEIIRNTIFARHGYSFKRGFLREFFEANTWYVPFSDNVDKDLTKIEKENIAVLKRLEQYAEDHYDSFGR